MAVKTITSGHVSTATTLKQARELTGILLVGAEELLDLFTDFTIWHLDIVLGGTVIRHEGQETVVGDVQLQSVSMFPTT